MTSGARLPRDDVDTRQELHDRAASGGEMKHANNGTFLNFINVFGKCQTTLERSLCGGADGLDVAFTSCFERSFSVRDGVPSE